MEGLCSLGIWRSHVSSFLYGLSGEIFWYSQEFIELMIISLAFLTGFIDQNGNRSFCEIGIERIKEIKNKGKELTLI